MKIKIKTGNAKLTDSCCFITMPLSRFSDTFNIPHTKGTIPHMFNVSVNYNYVGPLPALQYYDPNGMKEPLPKPTRITCLILPKRFMSTAKQTFSYSSQFALSLETLLSQIPV